jgi:hypothetical protein
MMERHRKYKTFLREGYDEEVFSCNHCTCSLASSLADMFSILATHISCIQKCVYELFLFFRNYTGVISSIGSLLIIDLIARLSENESYQCTFSLRSTQHPLFSVLKHNKDTWFDVFNVMQFICSHNEEM